MGELGIIEGIRDRLTRRNERTSFELEISKYLTVAIKPYDSAENRILSDGTTLNRGDLFGQMSIWPGEGIKVGENMFSFARRLESEVAKSLIKLAQACQRDSRLKGVNAFGGYSHLAKIAPRHGFDVFLIEDEDVRKSATIMSYGQALMATKGNKLWQETERNYSPAQEALISRTELIRRFSPQSQK